MYEDFFYYYFYILEYLYGLLQLSIPNQEVCNRKHSEIKTFLVSEPGQPCLGFYILEHFRIHLQEYHKYKKKEDKIYAKTFAVNLL